MDEYISQGRQTHLAFWTNTSGLFCQDGEEAGDIQFRKLLSESRWTGELCQKVTSSKSLALKADEVIFLTRVPHFITRTKFASISLLNISFHKLRPVSLFNEHISLDTYCIKCFPLNRLCGRVGVEVGVVGEIENKAISASN